MLPSPSPTADLTLTLSFAKERDMNNPKAILYIIMYFLILDPQNCKTKFI